MNKNQVINLDTLYEICGGEKSFIIEMIDLFLEQADSFITDIESASINNDDEIVKKKAHKFKSSAQIFGIIKLYDILLSIEGSGLQDFTPLEKNNVLIEMKEISDLACDQLKEERKKYV